MPITQSLNSKGNVKKLSTNDVPNSPQFPVVSRYEATSTAGQTVINLSFSVDQSNTDSFLLSIDGKIMRSGASNDFTFTAVSSLNRSSQITMNYALPINLNIIAVLLGVKKEAEFNMDNRFVQLYNSMNAGFQNFVDTSVLRTATTTTGTPAAGTFYSSITGRASIVDLSQDLRTSFGPERIMNQQFYQLQNEFGPNGEPVFAVVNDDRGLIRLVGAGWAINADANGVRPGSSTINDYCEITFYGTGLNYLAILGATAPIQYSVDGGSLNGSSIQLTGSSVLNTRSYAPNQVVPVVSNLALGVHTVKLQLTTTGYLQPFAFEIINSNSATALNVNSGISYGQGQKITSSAVSNPAYNSTFESGTLGSRGGHVVVYQKSDGTIAKAVTPANASPAVVAAADHTNEEVLRTYHWREFSAGRADDFSTTAASAARTFTLDDGTTTLCGSALNTEVGVDAIGPGGSGSFITFTFVGTGLDFVRIDSANGASADTFQYYIDGTQVGSNVSGTGSTIARVQKVVSGLPYGTHTFRLQRVGAGAVYDLGIKQFIVYQPKKPSIPTGATELADYNVMATYVPNSVAGLDTIATGVLRKMANREFVYSGASWGFGSVNPTTYTSGVDLASNASGAYVEHTFFGTGFEIRSQANTTYSSNVTVSLQNLGAGGSLLTATTGNFPTLAASIYGGMSFSAGILSEAGSNTNGSGISVNSLPLSLWKVRFTNNTSNFITIETLDVITPIHSVRPNISYDLQNTLPVGSCSISDNRKTSPIKDTGLQKKNIAQATGISSGPTSGAVGFIPLTDMSVTHLNTSGMLDISYSITTMSTSGSNNLHQFQVYIDGLPVGTAKQYTCTVNLAQTVSDRFFVPVSPGVHKVDVFWSVGGGTLQATGVLRNLIVKEN